MKLINIQDGGGPLPYQIFRLPWALLASEQVPKFRGLQEHCPPSSSPVYFPYPLLIIFLSLLCPPCLLQPLHLCCATILHSPRPSGRKYQILTSISRRRNITVANRVVVDTVDTVYLVNNPQVFYPSLAVYMRGRPGGLGVCLPCFPVCRSTAPKFVY